MCECCRKTLSSSVPCAISRCPGLEVVMYAIQNKPCLSSERLVTIKGYYMWADLRKGPISRYL